MKELNAQQELIINDNSSRLLVLAAAGVGKTTVLVEKIKHIIKNNYNPQRILAITFTNKAANEMKSRLSNPNVNIFTFHSFCARILRNHGDMLNINQHFQISDSSSIIKQVFGQQKLNYIYRILEDLRNEGYDIKDITDENNLNIYRVFRNHCKSNNIIDFQDLIIYVLSGLQTNIKFRELIQSKYDYILVDEFQDTNIAQLELVKLITSDICKLMVVGDDCQAIHEWRGANVTNILYFNKHFPDSIKLLLETNYRSQKNILELANKLISNNIRKLDKKLLYSKDNLKDNILYKKVHNASDEAEYIAKKIIELNTNKTIAILYRTNAQSRLFEDVFTKYNIKYHITGAYSFYKRKEIKDILAVIKVALNIDFDGSNYNRCLKNLPNIGNITINKITEYSKKNNCTMKEASIKLVYRGQKIIKQFLIYCNNLINQKPISVIKQLVIYLKIDINDIEIEEHIASLCALAEETENLLQFIDNITLEDTSTGIENIKLMTLHASKGLEFDIVFLTGMADDIFPHILSKNDKIEEERRLCYVGITRAKEYLYFTIPEEWDFFNKGRRKVKESQFITEIL